MVICTGEFVIVFIRSILSTDDDGTVTTLGDVIGAFKSITTDHYIIGVKQNGWTPFPGKLWQRNYYERVIRNEDEPRRVREYIIENPMQ